MARIFCGLCKIDPNAATGRRAQLSVPTGALERDLFAVAQNLKALTDLGLDVPIVRESAPQWIGHGVDIGQRKLLRQRLDEKRNRDRPRDVLARRR